MKNDLMFSSKSDEWATPQDVFNQLNAEFRFDVDLAATAENAKVPHFYTKERDALSISWSGDSILDNLPCGWLDTRHHSRRWWWCSNHEGLDHLHQRPH